LACHVIAIAETADVTNPR